MNTISVNHHYVPEWYQKLFFLDGQTNYHYYDKHPDIMLFPNGCRKRDKSIHCWGAKKCFSKDYFYTILSLRQPDFLEKIFFGEVDRRGSESFPTFKNDQILYRGHEYFHYFIEFMSIQRLRTPKGFIWLKELFLQKNPNYKHLNESVLKENLLQLLVEIRKIHNTLWTEGVWEIVSAETSEVKFIVSDNPVTLYNPKIFPGDNGNYGFYNLRINLLGTRTIYPLGINHCLIITNKQYALNPGKNHLKERINSRIFGKSHFNILDIIRGRQLVSDEVDQINSILKSTAHKYVASAKLEWLQIEKNARKFFWPKIDKILLPDKGSIKNHTYSFIGNNEFISGLDQYGQPLSKEILEMAKKMVERIQRTSPGSKILAE